MKKVFPVFVFVALAALAGCASTGSAPVTTANQPLTLDQALQKSAETRQKLMEAKESYEKAKTAADVVSGKKSAADVAKENAQKKMNNVKNQIEAEKQSWKNTLN